MDPQQREENCVICGHEIIRAKRVGKTAKYCTYCKEPAFRLYNSAKQHWYREARKQSSGGG